jgi:aminoglycoside phosphotransferase (APT) family kinase protein
VKSLTQESLGVIRQAWSLDAVEVVSLHQTVPSRLVARVATPDGHFAAKVDTDPHVSVIGGESVQARVAALAPGLAPAVLPTTCGGLAVTVDGQRYTMTEWVDGTTPGSDPQTWQQIGGAFARLHGLPVVERSFAVPVRGLCEELAAQPGWPRSLVREVLARAERIEQDGSPVIVHGQPSPANMLQLADRNITLLDWDESGAGPPALDLGYPLVCEFLSRDLQWSSDRAAAFYRGYREHATAPLPPAATIFAAALLFGLRSATFAEQTARLRRVQHALDEEEAFTRVLE